MMFRLLAGITLALVLFVAVAPHALAASIWTGTSCVGTSGGPDKPCSFCDALIVGRNIITFLTEIAVSITTLMIVVGAIQLVIAGGDPGKISDAKRTMGRGLTGLLVVMSAWTLMNALLIFIARGSASDPSGWKWNEIQCQ